MDNQTPQPKPPILLLWFAYMVAIFVYLFVSYLSRPADVVPFSFHIEELKTPWFLGVVVLSIVLVIVARLVLPKFLTTTNDDLPFVLKLMQFAFSEAAAILGLVGFFSGQGFTQQIVLSVFSLLVLLTFFPKEDYLGDAPKNQ